MEREGNHHRGCILAFGYSRHAEHDRAAFHKPAGTIIKMLTMQEILNEQHVQHM